MPWSSSKGHGHDIEPHHRILTVWTYAVLVSYYVINKMEIKVAKWGTPKKNIFLNLSSTNLA